MEGKLTHAETALILRAPQRVERLADGSFRIEKAGMVGVGRTMVEAARDLGSKIAIVITRPSKWPPEEPTDVA